MGPVSGCLRKSSNVCTVLTALSHTVFGAHYVVRWFTSPVSSLKELTVSMVVVPKGFDRFVCEGTVFCVEWEYVG